MKLASKSFFYANFSLFLVTFAFALSRVLFLPGFFHFEFRFRRQFLSYVFGVGLFSESLLQTISFSLSQCYFWGKLLNFVSLMHAPLSGLLFKLRDYCRLSCHPAARRYSGFSVYYSQIIFELFAQSKENNIIIIKNHLYNIFRAEISSRFFPLSVFVNYVIIILGKFQPFKRNFPFVNHT